MDKLNDVQRAALTLILKRENDFRSRVVPTRVGFQVATANALAARGLLSRRTLPHVGYQLTEKGRAAANCKHD